MQLSSETTANMISAPGQSPQAELAFHPSEQDAREGDDSSSNESVEGPSPDDMDDDGLGDAARGEREYVNQRLREELEREPTKEEIDEWLREHTEGY